MSTIRSSAPRRDCAARAVPSRLVTRTLALALALAASPAGALSFFPARVVLDDQHRSAVLRVVNKDDVPRSYIITWHRMRMTPDRGLRPVADGERADDLRPARDHVLFAPRQAVVAPSSTQAVRLMARVPADLPPGEYRSHLMITEAPRETTAGAGVGVGVRMQIQVVSRTTLPVILRRGDPQAQVSVDSMRVDRAAGGPRLDVTLGRTGERSVYANAAVEWEAPDGKRHEVFGPATVVIYPELDRRAFSHPLDLPPGSSLDAGTLHYVLTDHPAGGGSERILVDRRLRVR